MSNKKRIWNGISWKCQAPCSGFNILRCMVHIWRPRSLSQLFHAGGDDGTKGCLLHLTQTFRERRSLGRVLIPTLLHHPVPGQNNDMNREQNTDGLVQNCSNCSVLAMELLQSCTKPSIYHRWYLVTAYLWQHKLDSRTCTNCIEYGGSIHWNHLIRGSQFDICDRRHA